MRFELRPGLWTRERSDLALLGAIAGVVLATWLVLLGWRPGIAMSQGDIKAELPWFELLAAGGGDWHAAVWDHRSFGGVRLHDAFGTAPLTQLLLFAGASSIGVVNGLCVVAQIAIGFFLTLIARQLAAEWRFAEGAPPSPALAGATLLGCAWLAAFAPIVGDRIWQSHFNILWGLAVVLALAAVLVRAARGGLTLTLGLAALLATANGLAVYGWQIVVYGGTVTLPLLFALGLPRRSPAGLARGAAAAALVALVAAALVAPRLAGMFDLALSTDFPRAAPDPTRYNIPLGRLQDWVASLPWGLGLIDAKRGPFQRHELMYPIGPLLLAAALVPWRRVRPLGWGLLASVALVAVLSMRVEPLVSWATELLPGLGLFRMPSRAALAVVALFTAVGVAALLRLEGAPLEERRERAWLGAGAVVAVTMLLVSSALREVALWAAVLALLVARHRLRRRLPAAATAALLVVLGAGSVAAFRDRAPLGSDEVAWLDTARRARAGILAAAPELDGSLARVRQLAVPEGRSVSMATLAGIASLDGYGSMLNRYRMLAEALTGRDLRFGDMAHFNDDKEGTRLLERLYNVTRRLRWQGVEAHLTDAPEPLGPAWFPTAVRLVPDFGTLAKELLAGGADLRATAVAVANDPLLRGAAPPEAACTQASVGSVRREPQGVVLDVSSPASCLLAVSMSFAETLRARDDGGAELATLPLYGALLGVRVPAGTTRVHVAAEPVTLAGASFVVALAWLAVAAWGARLLVRRRPNVLSSAG